MSLYESIRDTLDKSGTSEGVKLGWIKRRRLRGALGASAGKPGLMRRLKASGKKLTPYYLPIMQKVLKTLGIVLD